VRQRVPKKSAVLACLTMAKLKINQHVPNKNADLLKKISLMGTESDGLSKTPSSPKRHMIFEHSRYCLPNN